MGGEQIRLTEEHGVEGGVRCPVCGSFTSFGDIVATGACAGGREGRTCDAELALDLIVNP